MDVKQKGKKKGHACTFCQKEDKKVVVVGACVLQRFIDTLRAVPAGLVATRPSSSSPSCLTRSSGDPSGCHPGFTFSASISGQLAADTRTDDDLRPLPPPPPPAGRTSFLIDCPRRNDTMALVVAAAADADAMANTKVEGMIRPYVCRLIRDVRAISNAGWCAVVAGDGPGGWCRGFFSESTDP